MVDFVFFKKGKQITALEKSDVDGATQLADQGYEKQFEEIDAHDPEKALLRFLDIRNEEVVTEHAFATGAVFSAISSVFLK